MTYPPSQPPPPGDWPDPSWPAPQPFPEQPFSNQQASASPIGYPPQSAPPVTQPPVMPQPPLVQPIYPMPMANRPTNGLAIGAFVCSLIGLATCGITSLVGAIMGHVARRQIRESGEEGDGLALAGIVIGWTFTALFLAGVIWFAVMMIVAYQSASDTYDTDQPDWDALLSGLNSLVGLLT